MTTRRASESTSARLSKNTDPSRGCDGKQRFLTYGQAERVAKQSRFRNQRRMAVYHCHHCAGFHFGNKLRNRRLRRKDEINLSVE